MPRPLQIVLIASLALAASATSALAASPAGQYTSWSCRNAAGTTVPTTGWTNDAAGKQYGLTATVDCASPGQGLHVDFGNGTNQVQNGMVSWQYHAPPNTTLGPVSLNREYFVTQNASDTTNVSAAVVLYSGGTAYNTNLVEQCQAYFGPDQCYHASGPISVPGGGDNTVTFQAGCLGAGGPDPNFYCNNASNGRAGYSVYSASATINDATAPVGSVVSGSAASGTPLSGDQTVSFSASDTGSGLLAAQVSIDNTVVLPTKVLDANGGSCTLAGRDGGFNAWVPCRTDEFRSVLTIPTTGVYDGAHQLYVHLFDAAGNTTVLSPITITTKNGNIAPTPAVPLGPPNGAGGNLGTATFTPASKKKSVNVTVGHTVKLTGHLLDAAGAPITGATIDVVRTIALGGAQPAVVGTTTTDGKGAYTYRFKAASASTIALSYAPNVGSTAYTATSSIPIKAKAAVTLKLSRSRVGVGGLVRFTGTVNVDPQPVGGARVVIEASSGKRWVLAGQDRTTKKGTFTYAHHFGRRATFRFRARVLSSATLAAKPASSASKTLRVG